MAFRWTKTELIGNMRRHAQEFPERLGAAMLEERKIDLKEVGKRTPVKTGDLLSTEHLEGPTYHGRNVEVTMVAGGPDAPYAPIVENDLEAFHPIGQARFMGSVINESAPYMSERIAARLRASQKK